MASGKEQESENAFVGGKNRWAYSAFVNWEFWWPGFPVLVYFKVRVPASVQVVMHGVVHCLAFQAQGDA